METAPMRHDEVNEHIRLHQLSDGLTFGTDAYLLSCYVKSSPKSRGVDLGSGTGIIPLLCLSRHQAASFVACEIQTVFCDLIARNAEENGMAERLTVAEGDLRELTAAKLGFEADVVTANPPYMAPGVGARNTSDEKYLARHEVNGGIEDFCAAAGRVLKHGGRFYCVFRPNRLTDLIEAMRQAHLEPKRLTMVQATYASIPSMVLVEAAKHAAPSLYVTPPLCLWVADDNTPSKPVARMIQTPDAAYIYDSCAFPGTFLIQNRSKG